MKFAFAAATLAVCAAVSVSAQAFDGYRLESATTLKNKGGGWDGVSLDQERGKLYLGLRKEGLQVFDLKTEEGGPDDRGHRGLERRHPDSGFRPGHFE